MIKGSLIVVNKKQAAGRLATQNILYFYNVINVNYIETVANAEIIS